ncbi:hypothetical protein ACWFRB_09345 [Rhodococcus sp. NPDC055112]
MTIQLDTVRLYQDSLGEYRWIRRAPGGRTIAESAQAYPNETTATRDLERANPDPSSYRLEIART